MLVVRLRTLTEESKRQEPCPELLNMACPEESGTEKPPGPPETLDQFAEEL